MRRKTWFLAVRYALDYDRPLDPTPAMLELSTMERCFVRKLDGLPEGWTLFEQAAALPGFHGGFRYIEEWHKRGFSVCIEYVIERGSRPGKQLLDAIRASERNTMHTRQPVYVKLIDDSVKPLTQEVE